MQIKTIYICNVCGEEHEDKNSAVYCHPDIVEEDRLVIPFKNRKGEIKYAEKDKA